MDIKEKIEEIVEKIKSDKEIASKFKAEPIKTVEELIGIDLPDDQIEKLVDGVKAKMDLDKLGSIGDKLGGFFGRK